MEKSLDKVLDDINESEGVTGCLVADKQGLYLGSRGVASPESSGILTAIAEHAKKLHPGLPPPVIVLENNNEKCIIQSNDRVVVSVFKQ